MGYNRFYLHLLLYILLLTAFALGTVYFLFIKSQYATAVLFILLLLATAFRMVYYMNRTNRVIGMYFDYLNENDPSLAWSSDYVERNFKGFRSALQGIMEQLKQARIDKEMQAKYLENVVDNIDTGLIISDSEGRIELVNQSCRKFLDIRNLHSIHDLDKHHNQLGSRLMELKPGDSFSEKFVVHDRFYLLLIRAKEMKNREKEIRIYTFHDIRTEMEEQEIQSWKKLIRVITHEIMNSITPITTLTLAIRKKLGNAKDEKDGKIPAKEDIAIALQSTAIIEERSRGLIGFIEKYRKITRTPELSLTVCEIGSLLEGVKILFEGECKKAGVDLRISTRQVKTFRADCQLVEQVLINLVKNALEALAGREKPVIEIQAYNHIDGRRVISVQDNGPGIPQKHMEQVFVPFFSTREGGSGIGLNLCRQVMRLHRGEISIQSDEGKGTIVRLFF